MNKRELENMTPTKFEKLARGAQQLEGGSNKFGVECLECGKQFLTSTYLPKCPKCGGYDIELA